MRKTLRFIGLLLLPALVALSCNYPLAMPIAINQKPPQEFWQTATVPPFLLAKPEPTSTPGQDATPEEDELPIILPTVSPPDPETVPPILYYTQAGDTLAALNVRFSVSPGEITSPENFPETGFINPDLLLIIPDRLGNTTSNIRLLPDSEFVYSPSAVEFDIQKFVAEAGGHLNTYEEYLGSTGDTSGADIVARVAIENSINPRLLLALLEYQSHWVYGKTSELNLAETDYPMGLIDKSRKGLYRQLAWAVNQLSIGYYGWREGLLTEVNFSNGVSARIAPDLNAGTVALQYYFANIYSENRWVDALDPEYGFPALHTNLFGNPWVRAQGVEPLFPPDLEQPPLVLPFAFGQLWAYTGGPHGAWEREGSRAAIDFAPGSMEPGCVDSYKLVFAAAAGLVTRSGNGIVMLDLDGDGHEQTGWGLLYLHVSSNGNTHPAPVGTWIDKNDFIGYPSCEGGRANGTHIHFARKFNGEWMAADGPIPFNIGGWVAHAGLEPYKGTLTRDGETITASDIAVATSNIIRGEDDP